MKTLAAFVMFSALAAAQIPANQMTGGFKNGRFWMAMSASERIHFIIGFEEGRAASQGKLDVFWPKSATAAEVAKGIDQFYDDPANLGVYIAGAMSAFYFKAGGETPEQVAAYAAELRRDADAALKKAETTSANPPAH